MKKAVILSFCCVFISFSSFCQNFYLSASGGYAWGIRKSTSPFPIQSSGLIYNNNSVQRVKKSLGAGFNSSLGGGYTFNKHHGFEAKLCYLRGLEIPVLKYEEINQDNNFVFSYTYGRAERLTLSLLFVANLGESKIWQPYVKLGPVVPVMNRIKYFSESIEPEMNVLHHNYNEAVSKSRFTIGFYGAAGLNRAVTKKLSVFLEASYQSMGISPKELLTTKVIRDGVDVTHELNVSEKQTIYKDELTKDSNTTEFGPKTLDVNKPYETLREFASADHLNVNAGIIYSFTNCTPLFKPKLRSSRATINLRRGTGGSNLAF